VEVDTCGLIDKSSNLAGNVTRASPWLHPKPKQNHSKYLEASRVTRKAT
jgi:hypothetical protein